MIPPFNASGVLPPYIGANPGGAHAAASPYDAAISEIHETLCKTPERVVLLRGLLSYREALRSAGIVEGFQMIDGSFTEDCERLRSRAPGDIDLVTFAKLPVPDVQPFFQANIQLFDRVQTKHLYSCDAFFVDLGKAAHLLVADTTYWFGLFSHQRVSSLWKGMLRVSLASDDAAVLAALGNP
ncbi:DUF6932 family protein [Methylibium rhizosphaerae]|uniref:DUF6932 family protein n=1 Tax=Methylibium rhizosphaerae TaxID=2570323 RepID=UPI003CCC6CB0